MNSNPLQGVEVAEIVSGHADKQSHEIWEANGDRFSVQHFFTRGGTRLGDHYHLMRTELITITRGTGKLFLRRVFEGQLVGELKVIELMPGVVVYIEPFVVHTFIFDYDENGQGQEILSEMWQHSCSVFSDEDTIELPLAIEPAVS